MEQDDLKKAMADVENLAKVFLHQLIKELGVGEVTMAQHKVHPHYIYIWKFRLADITGGVTTEKATLPIKIPFRSFLLNDTKEMAKVFAGVVAHDMLEKVRGHEDSKS